MILCSLQSPLAPAVTGNPTMAFIWNSSVVQSHLVLFFFFKPATRLSQIFSAMMIFFFFKAAETSHDLGCGNGLAPRRLQYLGALVPPLPPLPPLLSNFSFHDFHCGNQPGALFPTPVLYHSQAGAAQASMRTRLMRHRRAFSC